MISDRSTSFSLAYQKRGRGIMPKTLPMLCYTPTGGIETEITLVLDIDSEKNCKEQGKDTRAKKSDLSLRIYSFLQ